MGMLGRRERCGSSTRQFASCWGVAILLAALPTVSLASPLTYEFLSGTVTLRAILDGTTTSVLEGGAPGVDLSLGGSHAILDPDLGSNGRLLDLLFEPAGTIHLDMDEALVALDTVSIEGASIYSDVGATADLNPFGQFFIDTVMSGTVSGTYPPPGGTFGPLVVTSTDSQAGGALIVNATEVTLNLLGVNIAEFPQLAAGGPNVVVSADIFFTGNLVPEPSTGLLLALVLFRFARAGRRLERSSRSV